jgi:hypothetical protein
MSHKLYIEVLRLCPLLYAKYETNQSQLTCIWFGFRRK